MNWKKGAKRITWILSILCVIWAPVEVIISGKYPSELPGWGVTERTLKLEPILDAVTLAVFGFCLPWIAYGILFCLAIPLFTWVWRGFASGPSEVSKQQDGPRDD